jgi:hypothetical protein
MSVSFAIAFIVILDAALLGLLAYVMAHPRKLRPHVSIQAVPVSAAVEPWEIEDAEVFVRAPVMATVS